MNINDDNKTTGCVQSKHLDHNVSSNLKVILAVSRISPAPTIFHPNACSGDMYCLVSRGPSLECYTPE